MKLKFEDELTFTTATTIFGLSAQEDSEFVVSDAKDVVKDFFDGNCCWSELNDIRDTILAEVREKFDEIEGFIKKIVADQEEKTLAFTIVLTPYPEFEFARSPRTPLKVFISQPMKDRTEDAILAERKYILNKVLEIDGIDNVKEIPSYFGSDAAAANAGVFYLGESIKLMADADIVAFAPGAREARGCRIEHEVAELYGLRIVDFDSESEKPSV